MNRGNSRLTNPEVAAGLIRSRLCGHAIATLCYQSLTVVLVLLLSPT